MSTIFIAVQCCQCCTMQVKQKQKKSKIVNKWTCVVCNQRQSIRKVFAQGFMAKDLRHFVQTFNMSRKFSDHQPTSLHGTPLTESQEEVEEEDNTNDRFSCDRRKRRSDWSEYLDSEHGDRIKGESEAEEEEIGGGFEPKIVTEFPEAMFKKPKLNNSFAVVDVGEVESDKLYKPVFSKRNSSSKNIISPVEEPRRYQPRKMAKGSSKGNDYMRQDEEKPRRKVQLPTATAGRVSKWNDYMTTQDDTDLKLARGTDLEHRLGQWTNDILELETITHDRRVEDDVHPDFML